MDKNVTELKKAKRNAILKAKWQDVSRICNELACHYSKKGLFEDACDEHREELEAAEKCQDQEAIALARRLLGENLVEIGKHKEALKHHKVFLKLSLHTLKNKIEQQRAWATLGRTYYSIYTANETDTNYSNQDLLSKAENAYFEAAEIADSLHKNNELSNKEHAEMKARIMLNISLIYEQKDNLSKCQDCMKEAIFLCNKFLLTEDLHRCQFSLAMIYQNRGLTELALQLTNDAIKSATDLKSDILLSDCYFLKARLLMNNDNYNDAKEFARKAYKSSANGKKRESKTFYQSVIGLKKLQDQVLSNKNDVAALEKLADGLVYVGLYRKAIEKYKQIIDLGISDNPASIYYSLAETYMDDNQYELALEFYNQEIECNKYLPKEQVKTLLRVANVREKMGCHSEAMATYRKAKQIGLDNYDDSLQIQVLKELKFFMENNKYPGLEEVTEELENLQRDANMPDSEEQSQESSQPFKDVEISDSSDEERMSKRPKRNTYVVRKNDKGETPLHTACIKGNLKQVQNLIEKGHPVNVRDHAGWLPIHEAANLGNKEITECLLDNGAWVNDCGGEKCDGITPLHDAAIGGHFDVMETLLERGASVTPRNKEGATVLDNLNAYKEDNDLDIEELNRFFEMEETLTRKMLAAGMDPTSRNKRKRKSEERGAWVDDNSNSTGDLVMDDEELALNDNDLMGSVYNPVVQELTEDPDDPDVARREYQAAIYQVRKRSKTTSSEAEVPTFEPIPALIEENDLVDENWLIDDHEPTAKKRNPKRLRQTKLDVSVTKTRRQSASTSSRSNAAGGSSNRYKNRASNSPDYINLEDDFKDSLSFETQPTRRQTSVHRPSVTPTSCVKVQIKNLNIKIPIDDFDKTFEWLADEAALRYNSQTGMKPALILQHADGAMFSCLDKIGTMLRNGSQINGIIHSYNQPPIHERYAHACLTSKTKPSKEIADAVKTCQESGFFSLENVASGFNLEPIFKALHHEFALRSLVLSSADVSNEKAVSLLCQAIATFTNLTQLKLDCCGLNASFFKTLTESLEENCAIRELSLDYNDMSEATLFANSVGQALDKMPKLETLSLRYCDLTPAFFSNKEIRSYLQKLSLRTMDVAGNVLGSDGIRDYLYTTNPDRAVNLDFSHTQNKAGLGAALNDIYNTENHTVQALSLKACFLNGNDLEKLTDCVSRMSQLQRLDLSQNPRLTNEGVELFLRRVKKADVPLLSLNLEGTVVINDDNLTWFCSLIELKFLRNVFVTSGGASVENLLKSKWKNVWAEKANFKKLGLSFRLLSL